MTALALILALIVACGGPDPDSYEVTESSFIELADFGGQVPSACAPVANVRVPERNVSLLDRLSGAHVQAFYTDLLAPLAGSDANLLVPTGDHPAHYAAEKGMEFLGEAYACPADPSAT